MRCWIRASGKELEVRIGRMLIGRHDSCQIIIDDPLASRRHAALEFDGHQVTVHDLGSVNGVLVNGERIGRSQVLKNGDEIRLGNQILQLFLGASAPSSNLSRLGAETLADGNVASLMQGEVEEATVARDGEALATLASVGTKMLAIGRSADAERILGGALEEVLKSVTNGGTIEPSSLETIALGAVRLAEVTRKGKWIDTMIAIYATSRQMLPGRVIDNLYSAVRGLDGVDLSALRRYVADISSQQEELSPAQRFLVRRLHGLEQLVGFS